MLVGGSVAVMKSGVVLTGGGVEIDMQEVRPSDKTNRIGKKVRMTIFYCFLGKYFLPHKPLRKTL